MFRETLLESAPSSHKRKRWPMAVAFTAELFAAALVVVLPLLSTGVISVSAHVPTVPPLRSVRIVDHEVSEAVPSRGRPAARTQVVALNDNRSVLTWGNRHTAASENDPNPYPGPDLSMDSSGPPHMATCVACKAPPPPRLERIHLSVISEGQLVNRVEPVYPHLAVLTGTQGEVRLHAIIAKDGSIQSLNIVSGHPMLAGAAVEAVRQWRYRPYYLNGEAVEVETFITVNFKKTNE